MAGVPQLQVIGLVGLPEIRPGDDLAALIVEASRDQGTAVEDDDILVVTSKIVSKAEGRMVELGDVVPSARAREVREATGKDPRLVEVILRESRCSCAGGAGDHRSRPNTGSCAPTPASTTRTWAAGTWWRCCRKTPTARRSHPPGGPGEAGVSVAVIVSDTFGRPWREGQTNIAVGVAGMKPLLDYAGQRDPFGYELRVSAMAVADDLAAAAEPVMGKLSRIPVAIVRGFAFEPGAGTARELIRPPERDLFR